MRWTLSRQILAGYAISLLLLAALGYFAFRISRDMLAAFEDRRQANAIVQQAGTVLSLMQDAETGQRGYVLTGQERYLAPHANAVAKLPGALSDLKAAYAEAERAQDDLPILRTKIDEKLAELKQTIDLRRAGDEKGALEIVLSDHGKEAMDEIRQVISTILTEETSSLNKSNEAAQKEEASFEKVIELGIPAAALIMLVVGIFTARSIAHSINGVTRAAGEIADGNLNVAIPTSSSVEEISALAKAFSTMVASLRRSAHLSERLAAGDLTVEVKPISNADVVGQAQSEMVAKLSELIEQVQSSGVQVNSSAVQIAASSKEQQSAATEMASTTTEIGTTAKEMSATSAELLKAADNVNEVSQQLSGLATGGKEGLGRMEQVMRQIMEASSSITARLGEMNDKAGKISSVVTTITKIADQTNLLSLNAAIEAEKAGEYGRGFSVVASEIRRLADRTAASTLDIDQMVKEMLGSVSAGVMGMDKFSEEVRRSGHEVAEVSRQIDQMIERVQSLAPSIESVYEGMQAQTQGASQISEALSQLGDAARQTAEAIRESNRSVDQLNDATHGLQTVISRFKLR